MEKCKAFILATMLLALAVCTNNRLAFPQEVGWLWWNAGDSLSYLAMAFAFPNLPRVSLVTPFHHAQRVAIPYLLGGLAHLTGTNPEAWFFPTTLLIALAFLWLMATMLNRLGLRAWMTTALVSVTALNAYSLRQTIAVPYLLDDLGFQLGLLIATHGLLFASPVSLVGGMVLAALFRQTALMALPVIAIWIVWNRRQTGEVRERQTGASAMAISAISAMVLVPAIYWATAHVATLFAGPSANSETVLGMVSWIREEFSLRVLTEYLVRAVFPFGPLLMILAATLSTAEGRRVFKEPRFWLCIGIAAFIAAQPLLAGPKVTDKSVNRLTMLASGPFTLAVGLALRAAADRLNVRQGWGWAAAVGLAVLATSFHHIFSIAGEFSRRPDSAEAFRFALVYLSGSVAIAVISFLAFFRSKPISLSLVGFGFLALLSVTTRPFDVGPDDPTIKYAAGDSYSYLHIANAAPSLPAPQSHMPEIGHPPPLHHAQRLALPWVIGTVARAIGVEPERVFRPTAWLLAVALLGCVAHLLGLSSPGWPQMHLFALFAFGPYVLRPYLSIPYMLNDLGFELGLAIALIGMARARSGIAVIGTVVAILCRQTAILILPAFAYWVWKSRARRAAKIALAVAALATAAIWATETHLAHQFAGDDFLAQHVIQFFHWFTHSFEKREFVRFIARGLLPIAPILAVIVGSRGLPWRQVLRTDPLAGACVILAGLICLQPLLGGPYLTGASFSRLASMAILPLILLVARVSAGWASASTDAWSMMGVAIAAIASFHHVYSVAGAGLIFQIVTPHDDRALLFGLTMLAASIFQGFVAWRISQERAT